MRRRKGLRSLLVPAPLALAVLLLAVPARAEDKTVILKNGTRLTGPVDNESGPVVTVHTKEGDVRVPLNLIDRIKKADAPGKDKPKDTGGRVASDPGTKPDSAKPDSAKVAPDPGSSVSPTTAPVASFDRLEARYAEVAALAPGEERTRAILQLSTVPLDKQARFLALATDRTLTPPLLVAIEAFTERGSLARTAALEQLPAMNDCGLALYKALDRLWDKYGACEAAFVERLQMEGCPDRAWVLEGLGSRGTFRSVPAIVEILFFSPEKANLTWPAQCALREIAKHDPTPDTALEPLLKHVNPGWPGTDDLVRRRDVILAMGGSSGGALDYLAGTLAQLASNDLDGFAHCWTSLARIGTKGATDLLLRTYAEGKLTDAALESKRVAVFTQAVSESGAKTVGRPEFLVGVAAIVDGLASPADRDALMAALEHATGQRFKGETETVRRLAREMREKQQAAEDKQPR